MRVGDIVTLKSSRQRVKVLRIHWDWFYGTRVLVRWPGGATLWVFKADIEKGKRS